MVVRFGSIAIVALVNIRVRIAIAASFPYDIFIFQVFTCNPALRDLLYLSVGDANARKIGPFCFSRLELSNTPCVMLDSAFAVVC